MHVADVSLHQQDLLQYHLQNVAIHTLVSDNICFKFVSSLSAISVTAESARLCVGMLRAVSFLLVLVSHAVGQNKKPQHYFYNSVTQQVQYEDPGDVPFEDETGTRYWFGAGGERLDQDPNMYNYIWVEQWSEDLQRPYFYNQETQESQWERPSDLGWRRVKIKDEL